MKVLKFGGTSVATPDAIRRVLDIVAGETGPLAVVVSAFGGVTNQLLAAAGAAAHRDDGYRQTLDELAARHRDAARDLAGPGGDALGEIIDEGFRDLGDLLHGAYLLRECSPRTLDGIVSYGERLSSEVVAAALRARGLEAAALDARRLIVTDARFGRAQVDFDVSFEKIREGLRVTSGLAVIPGFIGATPEGQTTTLGRGGSDYTAALIGAAIDAEAIELWTDVDGVLSADPRMVPEAFFQAELSYAELMELSHFGAKVVYPPSIHPARSRGIPLWIKNTFDPGASGTRVIEKAPPSPYPIRGISSIGHVVLMRLEGDGMVGVPGIAMRLFGALARREVSVILISQGSSEHSICFAVAPEDAERARQAVDQEFVLERRAGIVDDLISEDGQSVIAAVGEEMRRRPGIAGRLFSVLGQNGVSVRAVAQGSSERNISLVIDHRDEGRALNAIHGAFFFPDRRRVVLAVIGTGRVGTALLDQLRDSAESLARTGLEIRVAALGNSRRLLVDPDGLDLGGWREALEGPGTAPIDLERLRRDLAKPTDRLPILVDCTASEIVAGSYADFLARGISVVAANKLAFAGSTRSFEALTRAGRSSGAALLFEATVGAGLPTLHTLGRLRATGHRIERIDAILSGTVNAVLDRLGQGEKLSEAVRSTHAEGLTEPRPYDDLSGADVGRKLVILARLAGWTVEPEAVDVEPLLPPDPWSTLDLETFWERLPEADATFAELQRRARDDGRKLRYVASLAGGAASVRLVPVGPDHPAFNLAGPDNLVAFSTQHYCQNPLVISGPGAGPAVTASGVFTDILAAADRVSTAV